MSWFAVGTAVTTTAYGAIESDKASDRADSNSKAAAARADKLSQEQIQFEQQRYDEWKGIFGDVQEQLSKYYTDLNPTQMTADALQGFTKERDKALEQVRTTLEQRGIATSGTAAQAEIDFAKYSAETRAKIRAEAPKQVAAEKLGFLQLGLQTNPANNLSNAMGNNAAVAGNQAISATNSAADAKLASTTSRADLINTIGTGAESIAAKYKKPVNTGDTP